MSLPIGRLPFKATQEPSREAFNRRVYIARLFVWADRTGHPGARDFYLDLWLGGGGWNPEGYPEREALEERGARNEHPVTVSTEDPVASTEDLVTRSVDPITMTRLPRPHRGELYEVIPDPWGEKP